MTKNQHVSKIREALALIDQANLFIKEDGNLASACVGYLRYLGYNIIEPKIYKNNARRLEDIPVLFYGLLRRKFPEEKVYQNVGRDLSTAKRMVENRVITTGSSREIAIKECYEIVEAFFENMDEFKGLYGPIRFELFGQKNMAWLTEKVIHLMNKRQQTSRQEQTDRRIEEVTKLAEKEDTFSYDLDSILKQIEEDEKSGKENK